MGQIESLRAMQREEYGDLPGYCRDALREAADEIERLRAIVALADEVIMQACGAFPLAGNRLRPDCLIIRSVSGDDYHERKRLAEIARAAGVV